MEGAPLQGRTVFCEIDEKIGGKKDVKEKHEPNSQ